MTQPYGVDTDAMEQSVQMIEEEERKRKAAEAEANMMAAKAAEEEKSKPQPTGNALGDAIQDTATKDPKDFDAGNNAVEFMNTMSDGVLSIVEDIPTLPERLFDSIAGEKGGKDDPSQEDYKPDWDPLGGMFPDRPEARTAWGKINKEIFKGVTLELGMLAARVPGARSLVGPAIAEGVVDRDSMKRDPLTKYLTDKVPAFEGVFDSPITKMVGNTLELAGFAKLAGYLFTKLGDAVGSGRRASSIEKQTVDKAKQELSDTQLELDFTPVKAADDAVQPAPKTNANDLDPLDLPEDSGGLVGRLKNEIGIFRGHKNKPIADAWQGSPSATNTAFDVMQDARRLADNDDYGSTDGFTTAAQAERMAQQNGIDPGHLRKAARELLGDDRFKMMMEDARKNKKTFEQVFEPAFRKMKEVTGGRDAGRMTPEEFWKPISDEVTFRTGGKDSMEAWSMENVVAADLINAEIFSKVRDAARASREIIDVADVMDVDGPVKVLKDNLIVGLTNVKRSRFLISTEFSKLKGPAKTRAINEASREFAEEAKAQVKLMEDMIEADASDDTLKAFLEMFSSSKGPQTMEDLSAYMKKKIGAWGITGEYQAGAVIRELQGVYVHSILSGPKTAGRAMLGTFNVALLRPTLQMIGGALTGDTVTMKANAAALTGFFEAIPEAFQLFKSKTRGYLSGDLATVRTRFSNYDKKQEAWDQMGWWINNSGQASKGDQAAYAIADAARRINDSSFTNYNTSIMAATDDSFKYIMARSRSKEKAMRKALDDTKIGNVNEVTPELMEKYQDNFYNDLLDSEGNIDIDSDLYLKSSVEQATLTQDISGFGKSLNDVMERYPFTKPFFLFARTGVNGMNLSYKSTPILGALHKQTFDIFTANADDLASVAKYGIETSADLANAKALIAARQAFGVGVTFMGTQAYLSGNLTGNGPADPQIRRLWESTGWKPRSIRFGDVWVSYDSFEPYNIILSSIADVGDNQKLMGEDWAENQFGKIAFIIGQNAVSKSYTDGLQQFVDLVNLKEGASNRIFGNLLNNQVPLAGLRNEIGNVLVPYMRELNSEIGDGIRNRNKTTELIAKEPLPIKYDMLNGQPIKDWNFFERMFNAISPVQISTQATSPGRTLLWNSNFDLTIAGYAAPDGTDLSDSAVVRSMYQRAIGAQNVEEELNKLAADPAVQDSVQQMVDDIDAGKREMDPMKAYVHNALIRNVFRKAQKKAWASIKNDPAVQKLIQKQLETKLSENESMRNTQKRRIDNIINIPK